jgi:alpha-tubulin suppressor-like RCC1 family protein
VYAFGQNSSGQLGDGTTTQHDTPEAIALASGAAATAIAAGPIHSAAIGTDGNLDEWGTDTVGQVGNGTSGANQVTPDQITLAPGVTALATSAGAQFELAIGSNHELYSWGGDQDGQLGDGGSTEQNSPEEISLAPGVTPTAIAAGTLAGFAIGSDGNLYSWGLNTYGQLGNGTTTDRSTPGAIALAPGVTPVAISAGWFHVLAIGSDGKLYAWGHNESGELGDGTTTDHDTPEAVTLASGVTPTAVAASVSDTTNAYDPTNQYGFSLAIGSDGNLYAWGDNSAGELGDGTTTDHDTPEAITLASGVKPTAIAAGRNHSLAIGSDGNLYAWGDNSAGELGDGTTTDHDTPEVISLGSDVVPIAVAAGDYHSLVIGTTFAIATTSLPDAIPGSPYGPVTLTAEGVGTSTSPYTTTLKWKKITLPQGLKLSSAGVLSGTPNKKLAAGPSSVTVQVTETVTTLNGKKKVKTKTTVQATIPLTIS